ncbi:unnamed protein product [Didymodactylos carnosus]|uniref:Mab-21-like HhH/H2TH-like domain-containing protein n=1 Tax=Didymodactylos carnosus TaxID=1234261 RepID=A0A8S2EVS6_9BILA|nr:unnamed protein product [Didymodactylos carnosus]CAF4075294.1 unnamed protein product [Didymodactylos carnosus]
MYPAYVSGSIAEGQRFSEDIDFIFEQGELNDENELISTENDLYVQIKWNNEKLAHLPSGYTNEICCVNGFKMKQNYCNHDQRALGCLQANIDISVDTASILRSPLFKITCIEEFDQRFTQDLHMIASQSRTKFTQNFLFLYDEVRKSITNVAEQERMMNHNLTGESLSKRLFYLVGPAYGQYFPAELKLQINELINYYYKYKHLSNSALTRNSCQQIIDKIASYNSDIVLALKLNFWPNNVQPFLERFQLSNQPAKLYEKIRQVHMYVVPKGLKTSATAEYEFRYSFSAAECLLAQSRTVKQRILNGIARRIYYKHLRKQTTLQSYFIKTSVLWMCEMFDNLSYNDDDDQCQDNVIIGTQWITYTCDLLRSRTCKHYFMDHINILAKYTTNTSAKYTTEELDKACQILENVDLSEVDQTSIIKTPHDVIIQYSEDFKQWLSQLNLRDVLNAINDFTALKLKVFPNGQFERGAIVEIAVLLNSLALLDGNKENNLSVWKNLFLDTDHEEIKGGSINHECPEWLGDPMEIIGGLALSAFFMKWINDVVTIPWILNSIKNSNFDLLFRLYHMTNKIGIFKLGRDGVISSYLPNAVNPYYQRTLTSQSIIDGSQANCDARLTDIIKKIYGTSAISPATISPITLHKVTENTAVTTINDLCQLGVNEMYSVVWYKPQISLCPITRDKLRRAVGNLLIFDDELSCLFYIYSNLNKKIFFMGSDIRKKYFIQIVQRIAHVHSIDLYCIHTAAIDSWLKYCPKVRRIYDDEMNLLRTVGCRVAAFWVNKANEYKKADEFDLAGVCYTRSLNIYATIKQNLLIEISREKSLLLGNVNVRYSLYIMKKYVEFNTSLPCTALDNADHVIFNNVDNCEFDICSTNPNIQIRLIVRESDAEKIIPRVHHLDQIFSIHIYESSKNFNEEKYFKIKEDTSETSTFVINNLRLTDSFGVGDIKATEHVCTLEQRFPYR